MSKFYLWALAALALPAAAQTPSTFDSFSGTNVKENVSLSSESLNPVRSGESKVRYTVTPLGEKTTDVPAPKRITSSSLVLVNENFDGMTAGTVDKPDYDHVLADPDAGRPNIDKNLTHGLQWEGAGCFSAGGAVAFKCVPPANACYLNTPRGDYSGTVNVSFLAKFSPLMVSEGGVTDQMFQGSTINVALSTPGNRKFNIDNLGEEMFSSSIIASIRLYEKQGWCRIDMEFDNYSAYNDASIVFSTADCVLIDDIYVTTSADKFLAEPVITGITNKTETSFTVEFEDVKKAFNYYADLYTLERKDEEGNPVYVPVLTGEDAANCKALGMTAEEFLNMKGYKAPFTNSPYLYYKYSEYGDPCKFTFTDLDPEQTYYYRIRSHYVNSFSNSQIYSASYVAAPVLSEPTDITPNSFTAQWNPIAKADSYRVNLLGVNKATEFTDDFILLEENFSKTSDLTQATDITSPEKITTTDGKLDSYTDIPGWHLYMPGTANIVDGMFGLDETGNILYSPVFYVGNAEKVKVKMRAYCPVKNYEFIVRCGNTNFRPQSSTNEYEGEFSIPVEGVGETELIIGGPSGQPIYFDYIIVTQDLQAGDIAYNIISTTDTAETTLNFSNLDADLYDFYGYNVVSTKGKGFFATYSDPSDIMLVNLKTGGTASDKDVSTIDFTESNEDLVEVARYAADGRKIAKGTPGLNIIRYSNGTVRKIMVK
ncbi:MAG: hypothetical protein NC201_07950 [Prevotella sp.]|nr:hypothetical protein [Bacteroides sp.]MCM1367160.1 hypothetical protein [Prevotella sp.]MCM1436268.1 hypothetical protein [Prevotella sp.]